MDAKSILTSKTFWSAVIPIIAGTLGLTGVLTADVELTNDTALWLVSLAGVIGGAGSILGRWMAKTTVTLPVPPRSGLGVAAAVVLLPLLLSVGSCETMREAAAPIFGEEKTESFERVTYQTAIVALDGWETTQGLILVYVNLPRCDAAQPNLLLCSKPKQVQKLKELNRLVSGELRKLRPLFEANPSDMETMLKIGSIVTGAYQLYHEIKKEKE